MLLEAFLERLHGLVEVSRTATPRRERLTLIPRVSRGTSICTLDILNWLISGRLARQVTVSCGPRHRIRHHLAALAALTSSLGAYAQVLQPVVEALALRRLGLKVVLRLRVAQRLLVLLLAELEQGVTRLLQFILQVKSHHGELSLRLLKFLDKPLVRGILVLDVDHVFE